MERISLTRLVSYKRVDVIFLVESADQRSSEFYAPRVSYRGLMFTVEPFPISRILAKWLHV